MLDSIALINFNKTSVNNQSCSTGILLCMYVDKFYLAGTTKREEEVDSAALGYKCGVYSPLGPGYEGDTSNMVADAGENIQSREGDVHSGLRGLQVKLNISNNK